jgi:hypothetical protein
MWNAAPRKDDREKKSSKDRKQAVASPVEKKSKDDATELKRSKSTKKSSEKTSSKDSSSDKTEKDKKASKPKGLSSIFGPTPPLSRSMSTRDKRSSTSGRSSSRRQSVDVAGVGTTSPPEDAKNPPEMSAKAAKMLGITPVPLPRSKSERKSKPRSTSEGMDGECLDPANEMSAGLDYDDEDIVIVNDVSSPEKSTRKSKPKVNPELEIRSAPPPHVPMPPGDNNEAPYRLKRTTSSRRSEADARLSKQAKQDDDIVMVDAGGPSEDRETPSRRRGDSVKKVAGLGGMFGGFLAKSRPEPKRRSTVPTDDESRALRREDRKIKRPSRDEDGDADAEGPVMTGGATEEDQEARRAARHARRAEREAAEKAAEEARRAKDEERRERRRKQEEADEARRLEEREARRAARRLEKAAEERERRAAEAKEAERAERRRIRRAEKEAAARRADDISHVDDPVRLRRSDRRRSAVDAPLDDEERRARREERRAMRSSETPKTSRRKSAPVDSYFSSRNASRARETEYLPAEGPVYMDSRRKKASWPHSGTDSWVKEHSDAPPPPEDKTLTDGDEVLVPDTEADENARRALRKTRRSSRYDDVPAEDQEERRRRRESRRAEKDALRSMEGSQGERRYSRRDSGFGFVEQVLPRTSTSQGRGSWWKKFAGV